MKPYKCLRIDERRQYKRMQYIEGDVMVFEKYLYWEKEAERLKAELESVTLYRGGIYGDTINSNPLYCRSGLDDVVIKRTELAEAYALAVVRKYEAYINAIYMLEDSKIEVCERCIVILREVQGQKWREIATDTGYSECQAKRIYRNAMDKIKDIPA